MNLADILPFLLRESIRFVSPPAVAAEWILAAVGCLLVWAVPAQFLSLARGFRALAQRKRLSILVCALLPVVLRLSLGGVIPVPDPSIHDEFSHLLLGDTLAHGRLANPTHPLWPRFESIHIIQQPTYASMYPPAQGIFLAIGERAFHLPWAGVVISVSLMCAAVCWMLQGWLPPAWALFGTLLLILKIGVAGFWMNSYLGGSPAAIGGALLIGSLPRIQIHRAMPPAILGATGLVILVNSRPFDGGILALAAVGYLALRLRGKMSSLLRPVVIPFLLVGLCGAAATGYYCWRVTGSPLRMPYQVNRDTYGWPENLGFLPAKKLRLRDPVLQAMYIKEINHREIYRSPELFLDNLTTRVYDNWTYFAGPLLTIPLFFLPAVLRNRRLRALAVFVGIIFALNLLQMVLYPYHLGSILPCILAVIAAGCREIYLLLAPRSRARANAFAVILPLLIIVVAAMKQEAAALQLPLAYWDIAAEPHGAARAAISDWLAAKPGKQLVIVRYAPFHNPDQEWVYNGADIDGAKIVWARETDAAGGRELLNYFRDRQAWLLEADVLPARVAPYR